MDNELDMKLNNNHIAQSKIHCSFDSPTHLVIAFVQCGHSYPITAVASTVSLLNDVYIVYVYMVYMYIKYAH